MHFCSPCEAIIGCHSCPFLWYPICDLQPPLAIITVGEFNVPDRLPSSFITSVFCFDSFCGLTCAWKSNLDIEVFKLIAKLTSGHLLQQAFLSGRYASFSLQLSGGHCTLGHDTSKLFASHVQTAHVSKPFGGKYGCHDDPVRLKRIFRI